MSSFVKTETKFARKRHVCCLCNTAIEPGVEYVKIVSKEPESCGGHFYYGMMHLYCLGIAKRYWHEKPLTGSFDETDITEDIRDRVCSKCPKYASCNYSKTSRVCLCKRVESFYRVGEQND